MSVLDIKIRQDWGKDGYTFEKDAGEAKPPESEGVLNTSITVANAASFAASTNPPPLVPTNVNGEDVRQGTLAAWASIQKDTLIEALMDTITQTSVLFELMEFQGIQGNALHHSGGISSLMAHCADVNHISNDPNQKVVAISSKTKSISRTVEESIAKDMQSLAIRNTRVFKSGRALDWQLLDDILDAQKQPSFLVCHAAAMRDFKYLQRNTGGAVVAETIQLPSGRLVPAYRGVPMLRSDYMEMSRFVSVELTELKKDSRGSGVCGLIPDPCPMSFSTIGPNHDRIKMYAGMASMGPDALVLGEYVRAP